jgi:hypothetical protein
VAFGSFLVKLRFYHGASSFARMVRFVVQGTAAASLKIRLNVVKTFIWLLDNYLP